MIAKLSVCPLAAFLAASLIAASADAVPIVLNSSLTGPVASGTAPPDWFAWQNTPDTVDSTGPFNNTGVPWTLSPDGGTFVRGGGSLFPSSEAIAQDVSTFTIGQAYEVSFFQTNLGFEHAVLADWLGEDGYWELVINGVPTDTSTTLSKPTLSTDPIVWSADTMTFVAPTTTVEVALVARHAVPGGRAAYMGIDGVDIRATTGVPEPGAVCLLVAAVGCVLGRRRSSSRRGRTHAYRLGRFVCGNPRG